MSKIRINDLARELEVKSKSILDVLPEIGVTEKKSHSSSLEDHEAEKVRARLRASSAAQTSSRSSRPSRADADEIKTKIDLSHISKPGDALKAIISKQQPASAAEARAVASPPAKPAVQAAPPAAALLRAAGWSGCGSSSAHLSPKHQPWGQWTGQSAVVIAHPEFQFHTLGIQHGHQLLGIKQSYPLKPRSSVSGTQGLADKAATIGQPAVHLDWRAVQGQGLLRHQ